MSNYPYSFDNNITLPGVSGSSQEDVAITALRSAVFAIETELGVTPSGIYPDVRTRLDILESRIQFGISPLIPNDGYVKSPLIIWNVPQNIALTISDGYGAPTEDRLDGSLYMRGGDGYANNQFYVRLNGEWVPVQTEQFVASNDLMGYPLGEDGHLAQTVIGFYNRPLNSAIENVGSVEDGYHITWNNFGGYWEAQTGFIPGHDLMAFSGPYGRTGQTVIGLQGFPLSGFPPTDGYTLVWQASDNRWEPQARAMVFDGYVARINLRSNRAQQSPILNTKTGIVNLGTDTSGLAVGANNDYSIILGGDRNEASGIHSIAIGGFRNIATDGYSLVVGGNTNTASNVNATVVNGITNTASGVSSFIGNGTSNTAGGNFSAILNGTNNSTTAGSLHTLIGVGTTNAISGGALSQYSTIIGGNSNAISSGANSLMGVANTSSILSDFSLLFSGSTNTINTLSHYSTILTGTNNSVSTSSQFALIGSGQTNTVSGNYAMVLNANTSSATGLNAAVLKGLNNSVTGQYSLVASGNGNIVNNSGWGVILDGYNNFVTGIGSFIADGYNNSVTNMFSTILNGNFNVVGSRNSTILNGALNTMDSATAESVVLLGNVNIHTNSGKSVVAGNTNTLTNASQQFILGDLNTTQSVLSFINGNSNTLATGGTSNRIFGSTNTTGTNASTNLVVGNANTIGATLTTSNTSTVGSNNIVDGNSGHVRGSNNILTGNFGSVSGQYGKSRMFGQHVESNSRFTVGKVGEVQASRMVMSGVAAGPGAPVSLQLQDTVAANPSFVDGYSYDLSIKVLIVNISPVGPNPVVPARYHFDVLAHQESGVLVIDNVNLTLSTPNTVDSFSRTPWTVTISTNGATEMLVTVDVEAASSYVQPTNSPSVRRAVATIEMREISRL